MEKVNSSIYYAPHPVVIDGHEYTAGYYFVDETMDYVGPFKTEQEATVAAAEYAEFMNGTST